MCAQRVKNKNWSSQQGNKMTGAVTLYLDYSTKAKESDLKNDIMLFVLGLDYEARGEDIQLSCRSEVNKRRLHLVLSGKSNKLKKFLTKLQSKKLEYVSVDDYNVSSPQPYKGKMPDWKYHDLVIAARASYLRTVYMEDIGNILEQLGKEKRSYIHKTDHLTIR
jgi:hypothetical protein